jgi:HSP20 family protein
VSAGALAAVAFGAVTRVVAGYEGPAVHDPHVTAWMVARRTEWLTSILRVATWLGSTAVIVPWGHRRGFFVPRRRRWQPLALLAAAGLRQPPRPDQITTWRHVKEDIMAKLSPPRAPAVFRALFPGLVDWLESPWAGPPQFTAARSFRVEEVARDDRYVIRAELPGLDPDRDIEVTVEGRTLTIHAERRQEDSGSYRSEFRYGSLTRLVRLPVKVDAADVTARYERGVLEVSVPARQERPEGIRVAIDKAD